MGDVQGQGGQRRGKEGGGGLGEAEGDNGRKGSSKQKISGMKSCEVNLIMTS